MIRTAFLFSALLASLGSGVALASPDGPQLEYREPSGVDVEAEWNALPEALADVVEASSVSFRGEILTTRESVGGPGPMTIVAVVVDEVYQGSFSAGAVVEIEIPLGGPISGDRPNRPVPVRGYEIVAFLDGHHDVVNGGIFLIEGGYAWRPNREGVLYSPRLQRDWEDVIDPIGEYDVFSMADLQQAATAGAGRAAHARRFRRGR
jgi:hypothetical protein